MTIKTRYTGEGSREPYALLDDRPFADKLIDANLRLLLKIIVYLPGADHDQPRSPAVPEQKKAHLAFLGREFQRHQLYRFRREREKRFALEFRILRPA